ncbi:DUF805 domain-containing protein [Pleomorphovibrio marinus]|uniref:DUF805 domain-containing protein n=1 Tax=Pleomorphovibrio marinus TaxID=2164132 RepID=UPI000E0C17B4|nr:DUF805 domain-containing protein [Pleomorphovibrio marinus]
MSTIFSPKGRITRRKYLTLFIVFYFINLLCLLKMYEAYVIEKHVEFFVFGIILITTIVLLLVQAIKRMHDIGLDWRYVLYLLIPPPVNLIGFVWLAAKKGQEGENEYGKDPRKTDAF